ncbi:MAG: hypothetical protein AAFX09_13555 [Pseudomonadota bacterium]
MNWKTDLRLDDLPADEWLEALCLACGAHQYHTAEILLDQPELKHAHLDEVEARLRCHRKRCQGPIRLFRTDQGDTEAFTGGLA